EQLLKEWNSPIYAFFKPIPLIEYIKESRVHVFKCGAKCCMGKSNGNLCKHAKICWGEEAVAAADLTRDARAAREALGKVKDSSITLAFERIAKGKVIYSHRQHTTTEAWYSLMKTGRPAYKIPSAETVSCDVKMVFVRVQQRIAKMLQEYGGALNFATDAWTSPNHKAYMAITVHFEHDGAPISMLLDLVEVAKSHSSV
ncbi:hypothetical protein B0H34DRAFT_636900, partial [Crassisporium funariophilum]